MSTPPPKSPSTTQEADPISIPTSPPKPKPSFQLPQPTESTSLLSRLQSFLPQLREANDQLEVERQLGILHKRRIEVVEKTSDDEDGSAEESSEEESSDEDSDEEESEAEAGGEGVEGKEKKRKQYIEMNLGLGVLEERPTDADGNVVLGDIITKEGSDQEMDDGTTVLDRLKGKKGKKGKGISRPNIEVVEEGAGSS